MTVTMTGSNLHQPSKDAAESTMEGSTEPWQIKAAQRFGLPTVFLCVLLWFIYCAGTWMAQQIAMPLFQKQTLFIDKATDMMSDMSDTLRENQTTNLSTQSDVDLLKSALQQQTEVLRSIDNTLKERKP